MSVCLIVFFAVCVFGGLAGWVAGWLSARALWQVVLGVLGEGMDRCVI